MGILKSADNVLSLLSWKREHMERKNYSKLLLYVFVIFHDLRKRKRRIRRKGREGTWKGNIFIDSGS